MKVVSYTHKQTVPATEWTVVHNLDRAVISRLDDAAGNDLYYSPNICGSRTVDRNTMVFKFRSPVAGVVRVVGIEQ